MTWESNNASADEWWQRGVQFQWHQSQYHQFSQSHKAGEDDCKCLLKLPPLHAPRFLVTTQKWSMRWCWFWQFFSFFKRKLQVLCTHASTWEKNHRLYWDHMTALFRQCGVKSSGKYSRKQIWNCIKWAMIILYAFYNPQIAQTHAHFNKREGWFKKGPIYTWY